MVFLTNSTVRRATWAASEVNVMIRTIAICAGSGSSCFGTTRADLYFTGEMGHHDVLAALARQTWYLFLTSVILCEHTNTERGYLSQVLQPKLAQLLSLDGGPLMEVTCSTLDKDPLKVV